MKTEEHIVVYLDMLGAKRMIREDQDESLKKICNLYEQASRAALVNLDIMAKTRIFSDNIVIAKDLSQEDGSTREDKIYDILRWCGYFLGTSVGKEYGLLWRGGITIGKFFIGEKVVRGMAPIDDYEEKKEEKYSIVWGEALIDSYEIEEKTEYPMVVIDDSIVDELKGFETIKDYLSPYNGKYFLDYMNIFQVVGESLIEGFKKMEDNAKGADDKKKELCVKKNVSVYDKLNWHKDYINGKLDQFGFDTDIGRLSLQQKE